MYYPVLWLLIASLVLGIFATTRVITAYRNKVVCDPDVYEQCRRQLRFLMHMRWVLWSSALALTTAGALAWETDHQQQQQAIEQARAGLLPVFDKNKIWQAPDPYLAETDPQANLIEYGRDLIAHTQDYFGAQGTLRPGAINALNCQNCHLDAGTKPFGNNYFAVASTYPQMRARSGALESISKRINDCFQRSLNGQPIDTTSREMQAMIAYMRWLGTGVPKQEKPKGTGLVQIPFLERPANPARGQAVYAAKCATCHGADGQGLPMPESARQYPPLWGDQSYNQAAGLFRMSRLAAFVKANMPFGASYDNPQLSNEEAWDVAAFINTQPRPAHPFLATDWPKIEKKPFDHPFGPYADSFPQTQHQFGPFAPIVAFYQSTAKKN
jgi:thiosulfate dehydrogenase